MKHKEFIKEYTQKMGCNEEIASKLVETFIEIILDSMKKRESVTIEHFGRFYIEDRGNSTVFKFTPSQKFKAILGWSNNYTGEI